MPATIVVGSKNILTSTFDTTAKTLKILGCTAFDLTAADLVYVWDTTTSSAIQSTTVQNVVSCTRSWVAGAPVFTYLFSALPAGVANGDTLLIYLQIPEFALNYLALQKLIP